MRRYLLLLMDVAAVFSSELQFVSLPESVRLVSSSAAAELRTTEVPDLNALLLGLSAKPVNGFDVECDLFRRPRAVAIVLVKGIDTLAINEPNVTYKLKNDGFDKLYLDEELGSIFGSDREIVMVSSEGITGAVITDQNATGHEDMENIIKTKSPLLREEIKQVYLLAAAIKDHVKELQERNAPDVYLVTISDFASHTDDSEVALSDIRRAIEKLSVVLSTAYNNRAILELLTVSDEIKPSSITQEELHIRRKRADATEMDRNLKKWREQLNVYVFVGTDYPAIFAIFAGLTITLALAVLYTVVAMMSMDPSKDSIIYRMTTTRMKKA